MQESSTKNSVDAGVQCSIEDLVEVLKLFEGKGEKIKKRQTIHQLQQAPFRQHLAHKRAIHKHRFLVVSHLELEDVSQSQRHEEGMQQSFLLNLQQSHIYHIHTLSEIRDKIRDQSDRDPYTVDHFSWCEEPQDIAAVASRQTNAELQLLASRYLGVQICGVRLGFKGRSFSEWWRVGDRHVQEVVEIAAAAPSFRTVLEKSAHALLFNGIDGLATEKTTLLALARMEPEKWGGRARTAIDFVRRLANEGTIRNMSYRMRCLVDNKSKESLEAHASSCESLDLDEDESDTDEIQSPALARSVSLPAEFRKPLLVGLPKAFSTPVAPAKSFLRSVGTSLRPQDHARLEKTPSLYSRVSFAKNPCEYIHSNISLREAADYWRYVAGGEHPDEVITSRAARALTAKHILMQAFTLWKFSTRLQE